MANLTEAERRNLATAVWRGYASDTERDDRASAALLLAIDVLREELADPEFGNGSLPCYHSESCLVGMCG